MADKPKVIHFTYTWTTSGVSSFISNIARELSADYDQRIVVWENRGSAFDTEIDEAAIPIVTLSKGRTNGILDIGRASRSFRRYLKKESADIVHLHCSTSLELRFLEAAARTGVPIRIAHCHNVGFDGSRLAKAIKKEIHVSYKEEYRESITHRLACSQEAGEWLYLEDDPFTVIKNAIDVDKYLYDSAERTTFRERNRISEDAYAFCCTGRLSEQKNQKLLVESFARYHQKHPESVLLLAGDGPLHADLDHVVNDLGVEHCVFFLGTVSDIGEVLSASDGYVLPSKYEGFGTAVLEAQTNGLPCLLSEAVSPLADVVGNAIRLPWDASAQVWTQGLELLSGQERYDGTQKIRDSGYAKEKVASIIGALYNRALNHLD